MYKITIISVILPCKSQSFVKMQRPEHKNIVFSCTMMYHDRKQNHPAVRAVIHRYGKENETMDDPFYRGYDTPGYTPPVTPPEAPEPYPPGPPAWNLPSFCQSLRATVSRFFGFFLSGHLLLLLAELTVAVVYLLPVPNSLYHPPAVSDSNSFAAAGLIACAASHAMTVVSEIMIKRSSTDSKKLCRALVLCSVSKIVHVFSWAFVIISPLIQLLATLQGNASYSSFFIIFALQDIPLSFLALRAAHSIRNNSSPADTLPQIRFLDATVILNFILTFILAVGFIIAGIQGDIILIIIDPIFFLGMLLFNFAVGRLSRDVELQTGQYASVSLQKPTSQYAAARDPSPAQPIYTQQPVRSTQRSDSSIRQADSKTAGFVKQHLRLLITGHALFFAGAAALAVIFLLPQPNPFYNPKNMVSTYSDYVIGIIPFAVSHLIAIIADHILAHSSEDKNKMCRGLILFAFSRLLQLISWVFILCGRSIVSDIRNGYSLYYIITSVVSCSPKAILYSIQDIPLIILALKARKCIKNNRPALTLSKSFTTFLIGGIFLNTAVYSYLLLNLLMLLFFGNAAIGVIALVFAAGTIMLQLTLVKLSQKVSRQKPD